MSRRRLEHRHDGWYVVTEADGEVYSTTSVTSRRRRVMCPEDADRGRAEHVAVLMGLITREELG